MQTVLIVEDDPHLRTLYTRELTDEGYQILAVSNGTEALAVLEAHTPHVAVLDIVMPGMDGIDLLGRLIERKPKFPVIINTAYPAYQRNYMTWPADAYIVKSSDLTELKHMIRDVLEKTSTSRGE